MHYSWSRVSKVPKTRFLYSHSLHKEIIELFLWRRPFRREGNRTHLGSINFFNHASSVFLFNTSLKAAERTLAKMGLAFAGMWRIVAHLCLETSSNEKRKRSRVTLLVKDVGPGLREISTDPMP